MSLRWKMALSMALLTAIATVAFGAVSYRSTADRLIAEVDQSLLTLEPRPSDVDWRLPERGPLTGYDAQVIDEAGNVVQTTLDEPLPADSHVAAVARGAGSTTFTTVEHLGEQYRVRTSGIRGGGAIQVTRSLDEVNRVLQGVRARTTLLIIAIPAAAAAAGWLIASQVTKPLRRLTDVAGHIAATGELDVRVGTSGADEVGRLGAGFDRMTEALARSRDDQQRLVQDAGHELRTPLTSVRTNIDLLRRFPDLDADGRAEILADMHAEVIELTGLVNEVVSIASGDLDNEAMKTFNLGAVAVEVAERFNRRADRDIVVNTERAAMVTAQKAGVQRAVSCLVENACKFDLSGSPVDITVSGGTITVADRGPGLDGVNMDRLFERFYRAESSRAMPGSGLGLSIVRDVAQRNNAAVTATAREGGGAVFSITIPTTATLPPPAVPPLSAPSQGARLS